MKLVDILNKPGVHIVSGGYVRNAVTNTFAREIMAKGGKVLIVCDDVMQDNGMCGPGPNPVYLTRVTRHDYCNELRHSGVQYDVVIIEDTFTELDDCVFDLVSTVILSGNVWFVDKINPKVPTRHYNVEENSFYCDKGVKMTSLYPGGEMYVFRIIDDITVTTDSFVQIVSDLTDTPAWKDDEYMDTGYITATCVEPHYTFKCQLCNNDADCAAIGNVFPFCKECIGKLGEMVKLYDKIKGA